MFGVHEHQHSPQQVLIHYVVLYVVRVVLDAERQELQDQREELSRLEIVWSGEENGFKGRTMERDVAVTW